MNVEIDVDELCSLRADLRALMEENEQVRGQGKVTCGGRTALEWYNYCTAAQAVHNIELNKLKEANRVLCKESPGTAYMLQQNRIYALQEENEKLRRERASWSGSLEERIRLQREVAVLEEKNENLKSRTKQLRGSLNLRKKIIMDAAGAWKVFQE